MAQKVHIVLEDDLDGGEATGTYSFALEGVSYEIDLNDANAEKLRGALAPFIAAGRKQGRAGGRSARKAPAGGPTPAEVRDWGVANGYQVPARGRIPADVRAAYDAAH